ncbi:LruC domain-containing protein [uncultured Bacteroides sp.]|uniref:LruC domain-containing protein n=1 Tax=uncultured Bacteroides sp. TaxID=162156 RepID=UPI002AA945CA|nr:LruC domain-containing protein [uncultured Bacteroides sp.]
MKITPKQIITIALLALTTAFSSCVDSEKDLYDPTVTTENPLGDLSAPNGFDFSTTSTINVNVDVNDEFDGQYYYTVKIFDNNPLATDTIVNALSTGTAKKGEPFYTEVTVPAGYKYIYIQQTDPRGRSVIKSYPVSESISCDFSTAITTKASVATRSISTRATVTMPDYTTIPTNATEISSANSSTALQANSNYKITGNYNGTVTHWGTTGGTKLYISGTWNIPSDFQAETGLEIIVMAGGKIETTHTLTFIGSSFLTIMPNGIVSSNALTLSNASGEFKNWGTANITNTFTASAGALFYTKGTITAKDASFQSSSPIQNEGTITLSGTLIMPSTSTLNNSGELSAADMNTQSNAVITNDGKMTFDKISAWNNATVNNNCYIESKSTANISGSIINLNKGYIKAQNLTIQGTTVNFSNGSMIEATNALDHTSNPDTYNGGTTGWSLLKAPTMTGQGFSYNGNLMVEVDNHPALNPWWANYYLNSPAQMAAYGKSNVIIEVCTGTANPGNPGTDPQDPTFPISVEDNTNYTYVFEDQWPLYGDYDMNDLVLKLNKKNIYLNQDNTVKEVKLEIELAAAGATKVLAAGLQLDNVSVSDITQAVGYDTKPTSLFDFTSMNIEAGQSKAVIPLFADAHKLLGSSTYTFVNTVEGSANNVKKTPSINIDIKFGNTNLTAADFVNSKLNFFIITDQRSDSRKEIHIAGYKPTDKANTQYFGNNNDNSSASANRYYISKDNLAWGIIVPSNFKYPKEYKKISDVYSKFSNWLKTGGTQDKDWYNTYDSNEIYQ